MTRLLPVLLQHGETGGAELAAPRLKAAQHRVIVADHVLAQLGGVRPAVALVIEVFIDARGACAVATTANALIKQKAKAIFLTLDITF